MERPAAILLIGPTGSGKTPLGNLLERRGLWGRPCRHFDFGARLRAAADAPAAASGLTEQERDLLRRVLRDGALLEDEQFHLAERVLRAFLDEAEAPPNARVVLNGLPRHVGQARDLDALLDVRIVVELQCPEEVLRQRIATNAGGDRAARRDDDAESVSRRWTTYRQRTAPLAEHYRARGARLETIPVAAGTTAEAMWHELNRRM